MKRENGQRKKMFEVYIDVGEDLDLARRKLFDLMSKINSKNERLVLVVMTEAVHLETEDHL